ncbi:MAG: Hsp33 family molecular chaperone HslO [Candidatus Cloacimonetes bacterium]|nr:Hsp33 family molecular chaperone HslO [Candidatus Cloacimonadota bacterium]
MAQDDILWRGTAHDGQFRILAVSSTNTAQTARDLHDLSPINTLLLGKMISATALMSLDLKVPEAEISLRLEGDGPVRGALMVCSGSGDLRGYAWEPQLWLDDTQENFFPVRNLGKGTLSVIRSYPNKQPAVSTTELSKGELAQNLAHYFDLSEQVPTAVNLGVLIDHNAMVRASGGFIIQQLPQADPALADEIMAALQKTPNVSDLMDMGLTLPQIITRFVVPQAKLDLQPAGTLRYRCNCSRERFERALLLLGLDELQEMAEGVDPVCHFCNTSHHFSPEDMKKLISEVQAKP